MVIFIQLVQYAKKLCGKSMKNLVGVYKEHLWFRRSCSLNVNSIFSSANHFIQQSGTIYAILVEGLMGNICKTLF